MLFGHIKFHDGMRCVQTLQQHSRAVARLCADACRPIGLEKLGYLTGLLHDAGKAAPPVQEHLRDQTSQKLNHASAGMRWLWESCRGGKSSRLLTAQMAALAIGCHHSGRCDYLSPDGSQPWLERMCSAQAQPLYQESVRHFFASCCTEEEVQALLRDAVREVTALYQQLRAILPGCDASIRGSALQFGLGLAQRFLFSALVDADWSDTAAFMSGTPLPPAPTAAQRQSGWDELSRRTEAFMKGLAARRPIDLLRQEISAQCFAAAADRPPGVYRLYVPTGGGKTYAGLRFCVEAARRQNAQRLFYFAPYKSIIRQNADCIREVLGAESVLEHHSDVMLESGEADGAGGGREQWLARSQRWQGVPVICTTMVQLLNTLFAAPRQNVRRLSALAGSVLLLDEIQSLPLRDTCLLNLAIDVLAQVFGCTVVLCTATQPELAQAVYPVAFSPSCDLMPDFELRFEQFRRTRIVPLLPPGGMRAEALADLTAGLLKENRSVLVILNTKGAVNRLFDALRPLLPESVPLFCLTTCLCSRHRDDVLRAVKACLDGSRPVVCVSTQLVEAGVDLSFDCVVRSLAGLPSVAQAAGRCNRHGTDPCRPVYLVECADENLTRLPEIGSAREAARRLLEQLPEGSDLLSPQAIREYYRIYYRESRQREEMLYPVGSSNMVELLSSNGASVQAYIESGKQLPFQQALCQAFGTAEQAFEAIPDETVPVLVPYRDGERLLTELQSAGGGPDLLQALQPYAVSVSQGDLRRLGEAVVPALDGAVRILMPDFYDGEKGLSFASRGLTPYFV